MNNSKKFNSQNTDLAQQIARFHAKYDQRLDIVLDGLNELSKKNHYATTKDLQVPNPHFTYWTQSFSVFDAVWHLRNNIEMKHLQKMERYECKGGYGFIDWISEFLPNIEKAALEIASKKKQAKNLSPEEQKIIAVHATLPGLLSDWCKNSELESLGHSLATAVDQIKADEVKQQEKNERRRTNRANNALRHLVQELTP